jgi:hypothetical protein
MKRARILNFRVVSHTIHDLIIGLKLAINR